MTSCAARQLAVGGRLVGELPDLGPDRLVAGGDLVRAQQPGGHDQPGGAEQRVAGIVRRDLRLGPVADLRVAARVPEEPHHVQVQERGGAGGPHVVGGGRRRVVAGRRVGAVGAEIPQGGPAGVRGGDPPVRGADADAEPVVLADEQQRDRQSLVGGAAGGVDRPGGGGVPRRGVAEARHGDRVGRPGEATPSLAARSMENATPTARGRCDAIVEVCGMTARSWRPKTLCLPPAIGSSAAPTRPSSTSSSA